MILRAKILWHLQVDASQRAAGTQLCWRQQRDHFDVGDKDTIIDENFDGCGVPVGLTGDLGDMFPVGTTQPAVCRHGDASVHICPCFPGNSHPSRPNTNAE